MMTDVSRFTMIEKERNDLLKEIQINKEYIKLNNIKIIYSL